MSNHKCFHVCGYVDSIQTKQERIAELEALLNDEKEIVSALMFDRNALETQNAALLVAIAKQQAILQRISYVEPAVLAKRINDAVADAPPADALAEHDRATIQTFIEKSGKWLTNEATREERDRVRDAALLRAAVKGNDHRQAKYIRKLAAARESGEWKPALPCSSQN